MSRRPERAEPGLLELRAELALVLGAVDAAVLTFDGEGRVRSQNVAAIEMLGGRVGSFADAFGSLGAAADDLPPRSETTELQLVAHPERWLELTHYHDPSEPRTKAVVIRDVTDARQRRELRQVFLQMLSHELRTPVTSIYAASTLLGVSLGSLEEADRHDLLRDIAEEAERLLRIIEDLLVLAHVDGGIDPLLEPSLLQRLIPVAVDRERRRWATLTIELVVRPPLPVVRSDEAGVQQVLRNLISYSAKDGGAGPIVVEVQACDEDGGVEVRVLSQSADQAEDELAAVFHPVLGSLYPSWAASGAGIGLYVGQQLVEAMGGRLWRRPRDGGLRELGFWLPAYGEAEDPAPPTPSASSPLCTPVDAHHRASEAGSGSIRP